jgi:Helix-turn-helix domain
MPKRPVISVLNDAVDDMQMLTGADLAAITGLDATTIAEKLSSGQIPGMFRIGTRLRILAKDFRAYVKQQIGVRRMELEGYSPEWIAMQLPANARKQYLESHKPGENWDPYAGARADVDPAALRAYEARMQKLVAAGLSEGEANVLKQLKANGIVVDRPTSPRRKLRSV